MRADLEELGLGDVASGGQSREQFKDGGSLLGVLQGQHQGLLDHLVVHQGQVQLLQAEHSFRLVVDGGILLR
jgi:hypothetical protein